MKRSPLKRKTPLRSYTPLKAKSTLKRKSPLLSTGTLKPKNGKKSQKRLIYGAKVWSLKRADEEFSRWLREQRDYTCEMCGYYEAPPTKRIQNSHYIGRMHKATRYDPENCDVLCASCHSKMEDLKQYDYREWKIARMGEEKHNELIVKARESLGEKDAIYKMMIMIGALSTQQSH